MTGYESKRAAARDKMAQPEQEPVACIHKGYLYMAHEFMSGIPDGATLLYTTPPQRTWVGPTGNEWFEWWRVSAIADKTEAEIDFADFLIIAQAVMTKLKEDNK